jgi:predicted methyltransferase
MPRLTHCAHDFLAPLLTPGAIAIDLTAGNGYDTLFLAQQVSPSGRVYSFDIQPEALAATKARLEAHFAIASPEHVELICANHAELAHHVPSGAQGEVSAVIANLGYLPGGSRALITTPESTILAIRISADYVRPGGGISILCYRGHPGGAEEADEVVGFFRNLDSAIWEVGGVGEEGDCHKPVWVWGRRRM